MVMRVYLPLRTTKFTGLQAGMIPGFALLADAR
jgi:hypothetical protein